MIALVLAIVASMVLAFGFLEVTLRTETKPDPLPLKGWTL